MTPRRWRGLSFDGHERRQSRRPRVRAPRHRSRRPCSRLHAVDGRPRRLRSSPTTSRTSRGRPGRRSPPPSRPLPRRPPATWKPVLLTLARHPHASPDPVAKNALTFFHWSAAAASSPSPSSSYHHSLRSFCLLVNLLSRAALFRDASVLLESAITKHSSSPASSFLDAFFAAYEDSGTAATTRGLHLLVHAYARLRLPEEALETCRYLAQRGVLPSNSAFNAALHAALGAGAFRVAWEVFELMTLKRVYANQKTVELVIGVLSREGKLAKTAVLVGRIHGKKCAPGIVAHLALTLSMSEEERVEQANLLLKRLLQRNILLDDIAYSLIVHAYCRIVI